LEKHLQVDLKKTLDYLSVLLLCRLDEIFLKHFKKFRYCYCIFKKKKSCRDLSNVTRFILQIQKQPKQLEKKHNLNKKKIKDNIFLKKY